MDVSRGDARHVALLGTWCSSMSWLVAQVPPGYPCPHVASGQPARWMNVSGDADLLPVLLLHRCQVVRRRMVCTHRGKPSAPSQHHPEGIICRLSD